MIRNEMIAERLLKWRKEKLHRQNSAHAKRTKIWSTHDRTYVFPLWLASIRTQIVRAHVFCRQLRAVTIVLYSTCNVFNYKLKKAYTINMSHWIGMATRSHFIRLLLHFACHMGQRPFTYSGRTFFLCGRRCDWCEIIFIHSEKIQIHSTQCVSLNIKAKMLFRLK